MQNRKVRKSDICFGRLLWNTSIEQRVISRLVELHRRASLGLEQFGWRQTEREREREREERER